MTATTDTPLARAFVASPNHGDRPEGRAPDSIILHYTGMDTGAAALARLLDPAAQVSCHYLVWEDGAIDQLVAENRRAWHAGASCWKGERDMNSASIGVEIVNGGHEFGLPDFPLAQTRAVAALCRDIAARRRIAPERVLAHSDIAPGRKIDPGEKFPWEWLAGQGVGVWPEPADVPVEPPLHEGDMGPRVAALRRAFADWGYDLKAVDAFDTRLREVVEAFQRHFRPTRVDGVADAETARTLAALLRRHGDGIVERGLEP